ncbi:hypothetical protein JCM8547_005867 [Rhodosporidiobolus lusitaniae]
MPLFHVTVADYATPEERKRLYEVAQSLDMPIPFVDDDLKRFDIMLPDEGFANKFTSNPEVGGAIAEIRQQEGLK